MPDFLTRPCRNAIADAARQDGTDRARFAVSFSRGERRALRYNQPMPVSQWAERYRVVENSSIRGKWQNVFTPYLAGVMDAAAMPGVETVILCKSPQTGGSEAGHNIVGYCIDRLPGPVMYVFPDEITARENASERIIPMITASPRLAGYMTGYGDDISNLRVNLIHMTISMAWSGSVSRLGNKPVRVLILDELDKYANPKNEARSEDLAEKRTTTWRHRRKIVKISTPTTERGPIWQAFTREANARFRYHVKCPDCGAMQVMEFERITWPGKDTADEPKAKDVTSGRLAWYACPHCGSCWNDAQRDLAVRSGEWREEASGLPLAQHIARHKPQKVAFHVPAWLSYFVSLSEVAGAAIRYRETGSMDDLRNLYNQYLAEPWAAQYSEREEDSILRLCDDRPRGAVPGPLPESPGQPRVAALIAGVDTQKGYFRYVIRAFGFGGNEESWLIQCGALPTFSDLEAVLLNTEYLDPAGKVYRVRAVMIDAMGNRTSEVYRWAARHRGRVFPYQGKRSLPTPYTLTSLEYFPGPTATKVKIPGGLALYHVDTTFFKSSLANKLQVDPSDPGAFHLHSSDNGELEQYARELCAEVWDEDGQAWINPSKKPNHFWDCEVMAAAMAYIMGVHRWNQGGEKKQAAPHPEQPRPAQRTGTAYRGFSRR